jgi:hypothetical protein
MRGMEFHTVYGNMQWVWFLCKKLKIGQGLRGVLFPPNMNSRCSFRSDGRCCYTRDSRPKERGLCQERWIPMFVQEEETYTFCWKDYCIPCYAMWKERCIGNGVIFQHPVMGPLYYFAKGTSGETLTRLRRHFPHSRLHTDYRQTKFHKSVAQH